MRYFLKGLVWFAVSLAGAIAYFVLAWNRKEPINSVYILTAALCTYAIGYRFYSKWIAARILAVDDRRATPCEVHDDGRDFVRTNRWIVFGHHFAAIAGPGPLVGPVLAAQFGYLPGTLWILIGVVLGGAVQDFVILFCSMRRNGKSLGQMVKEELNSTAGFVALLAILAIMTILLAVLALVVVKALAESPWGVFTVGATIPIAMFMGGYLRFWRVGKVLEATAIGVSLLLLAVWGGKLIYSDAAWSSRFTLGAEPLAWLILAYGLAASVLPVWLLLAPRDYLSTFMKLGTILALALGIFLVLPDLKMAPLSRFIDGSGPVVAGKLFPFCFITIACGAISGFHTLIASGTTPKLITRESYSRFIGYGAMCFESLVAIMALIAACTLEPGVYLSMNMKGAPADTVAQVNRFGFQVSTSQMEGLAQTVGEHTLFGRTGGAATLAVGMAQIFSRFVNGRGLDLWYHFAIMFEALFILTTLDAGTRVGRYLLQDALGQIWKPLGETRRFGSNLLASFLMVVSWGYFLIQGVRDPLGGVNSLWPLFGIANQLLAVVALALATTVILKMQLNGSGQWAEVSGQRSGMSGRGGEFNSQTSELGTQATRLDALIHQPLRGRPVLVLVTLVPLAWLLAVTTSAGLAKIFADDPRIGFMAQARELKEKGIELEQAVQMVLAEQTQLGLSRSPIDQQKESATEWALNTDAYRQARKAATENSALYFNQVLDAVVAGVFLVLVVSIVLLSVREWILLLARHRLAKLHETEPVWLPDYALAVEKPIRWFNLLALAFGLARELSGEAAMDRAQQAAAMPVGDLDPAHTHGRLLEDAALEPGHCRCVARTGLTSSQRIYLEVAEKRFSGINRCC